MSDHAETVTHRNDAIVLMTAGGANPRLVINALAPMFANLTVIEEQPEAKSVLLKRRARKLGWIAALGQLATMVVSRLGKNAVRRRSEAIISAHGLSDAVNPKITVIHVPSLNDPACHEAVARLQPKAVVTVSCRILSRQTLAAIPCPVINLHAGINPAYRGQMGGYWALASGDAENFGATVHLVDAGIDTGDSLYEVRPKPEKGDTMMTYPLLLTAAAIPSVVQALDDALTGRLKPYQPGGISKMHYNPTIWTWLWNGVAKGVW
ncbi:formyl transferase [Rhizobium sp. LjRoot30]|uniref:formyl transferase n=1 Tax=Rhizobium sp. LjRoot30 TaxID=3342320 RepID=UPI003ECE0433